MCRKLFFLLCLLSIVGCNAKKGSLTGQKIKHQELISKEKYRAEQRKKQEAERKEVAEKKKKEGTSDSEVLVATSRIAVTTDVINNYILQYKPIAQKSMRDHGIPASITLAQGVLESGSGQGTLSLNANNHFGIKCHQGWTGESVRHTDDAPDECFRKYTNPEESYRDHSLFLVNRSRYASLFSLDKDDYKGWATGLKKAGYATDPKYAEKLIGLIERYALYNYDAEVLGTTPKRIEQLVQTPSSSSFAAVEGSMHVVQKGETLYSISRKYNMTVEQVQALNNLKSNSISAGQLLKVK